MKTKSLILLIIIFSASIYTNTKYQKWQIPSYFRGYNVLYESPKTLQDFIDFKNYGGNLFHIQPDGFLECDAPYSLRESDIAGCDMLVNFCRQAGVYYVIGMRSGPGAYDTYDESQGTTGESRIWNTGNTLEQQLYADMLRMVVERYSPDTLFVGINLVIEPRPKYRVIPANTSQLYKFFLENVYNIRMDLVYNFWVNQIRELDPEIPILIENFAFSTPELFPAYEINDPYIIYSAHNYQPVEYTREAVPMSKTYPGVYWNISTLSQQLYNAEFLRNTVFNKLRNFETLTGKPVIIGEMGMFKPQIGGQQYLLDQLDLFTEYGWHFALWDWRRGPGADWNIERFNDPDNMHWKTVLSKFYAPPVPNLISPINFENVNQFTIFTWDTLTAFTNFDIEFTMIRGSKNMIFTKSDINASTFAFTDTVFIPGESYQWRVRSKNPFGLAENTSAWSEYRIFNVNSSTAYKSDKLLKPDSETPAKFKLMQNYPNPFNPSTKIKFEIPYNAFVKLTIFDILGKEVEVILSKELNPGMYETEFKANNIPSGIYLYRIEAFKNNSSTVSVFSESKKMVILK